MGVNNVNQIYLGVSGDSALRVNAREVVNPPKVGPGDGWVSPGGDFVLRLESPSGQGAPSQPGSREKFFSFISLQCQNLG